MATRFIRKTAILVKSETTAGTDAVPTEAANAMLVSNVSITPLNSNLVARDLIRPYIGGSEQLVGTSYVELSYDIELAGSGTAGTGVAYASVLKACLLNETLTASVRAEYNPTSPSATVQSATVYYFVDDVRHVALGCLGTIEFKLGMGERPVMSVRMIGLDGGVTAASPASLTLTGFRTPLAVTDANTGDLIFGCTYTAATPTLTGGTSYPSQGLQINLGNDLQYVPLLGGEQINVVNREVTGSVVLDLTAAQVVTFMSNVKTNTTQALGLMHGTTAGNRVMVFMPSVQLINPSVVDVNGRAMMGFDFRANPLTGNDEIKLVAH
jgi:hypothetical protein